jgi:ceramide glucosyltransferase
MPPKPLKNAAVALAVGGVGYLIFALARVRAFRRQTPQQANDLPGISVLKPLHGAEPELFENLCSFCEQDYPNFEVIFGVRDDSDAAAAVARRVVQRYPDRAALVVGDGNAPALNPKIANLSRMHGRASYPILLLADADMRVRREYLRRLVAGFDDKGVGAVTCLYAGASEGGIASDLGAMFINEQFAPSVLVANALEPLRYCFGATIAVRRSVLDEFGGFDALADHVADDHLLGKLVTSRGMRIELSDYVVENLVSEATAARPRVLVFDLRSSPRRAGGARCAERNLCDAAWRRVGLARCAAL